jgi:hypothetical protein
LEDDMSNTQNEVERLMHEKEYCADAERLWQIARELTRLGAWDAAVIVEKKARKIEHQQAAQVWR